MSKFITIYDFFGDESQRLTYFELLAIGEELNHTAMNVELLVQYSLEHNLLTRHDTLNVTYSLNLDSEER